MGLNCLFAVDGETVEEVTKQAMAHVIELHANDFNIIKSPEEILRMEKALFHVPHGFLMIHLNI